MKLNEVIEHYLRIGATCQDTKCAKEYMQLALWLKDYSKLLLLVNDFVYGINWEDKGRIILRDNELTKLNGLREFFK